MSKIVRVHAREILDSRGNPTIEVHVETEVGGYGIGKVPSGASTGSLEAYELRDSDASLQLEPGIKDAWFGGRGVSAAVSNVNSIIGPKIIGIEVSLQRKVDQTMIKLDGTPNKKKLGANAILGVSIAVARAAADERGLPLYRYIGGVNAHKLPVPMLNVLNGGAHATTNTLDFQEFMIMPVGAKTFKESMQMANKTFHTLAKLLKDAGHSVAVGDEGGFAPSLKSHEEALDFIVKAIQTAGYNPAVKGEKAIAIAMDAASSEFYDETTKKYVFKKAAKAGHVTVGNQNPGQPKGEFTTDEMITYLQGLLAKYPIISIEDGLAETDWDGFVKFNALVGEHVQLVGDDIFVTNKDILRKSIERNAANSVLIKVNQIGSLTETIDTILLGQKFNYSCVVSHRSGETDDTTIADLAVALNTGQIKTGSMSRTDRIAKYNRLLEIEEELGKAAEFDGDKAFYNVASREFK